MSLKEVWSPLLIAVLASMTQAFGISLQRKSHLDNPTKKSLLKQPLWITGFLVYTLSNVIGSTCTIGYLPIVILAPVGAIGLVFNAIFAKVVLNESFTSRTVLGTSLIVIGAGLIAGFGVVPEPNHSLQDLITLYKRPSFIVYFTLIEFVIVFGLIATHIVEHMYKSRYSNNNNNNSMDPHPDIKMWLGISYGVFGANISSQAMLFAKSGLELLILTIFHQDNQFVYPLTWVIISALIFTALLQLYYLNRGVQLCDTIILVPLNFCSFNVSCLFNGLVYYNQWDRLFWWQVVAVLFGITLLVFGVLVTSLRSTATAAGTSSSAISIDSDWSQPLLKLDDDDNEEQELHGKWWTRMKSLYKKKDGAIALPDENTGLLGSL